MHVYLMWSELDCIGNQIQHYVWLLNIYLCFVRQVKFRASDKHLHLILPASDRESICTALTLQWGRFSNLVCISVSIAAENSTHFLPPTRTKLGNKSLQEHGQMQWALAQTKVR